MKITTASIGAIALSLLAACAGHAAKAPDVMFGRWQAMSGDAHGDKLCYIGTAPTQMKGSVAKRAAQPYIMVTRRPSGHLEFSASSGYPYMGGSRVMLVTDGKEHSLFFKGMTGWAHDDKEDSLLIDSLMQADTIEIIGVSRAGKTSTDEYAATGLGSALGYIKTHCK